MTKTNLYDASRQWATRPADERFWTLAEMHEACRHYASSARQASVNLTQVRIEEEADDLRLAGPEGGRATFTNWSFGQFARRLGAPADYVATLPAPLAAACLNNGLQRLGHDGASANMLVHANGHLVCRAFTSDQYARIWNHEVTERLLQLGDGWKVPPARPSSHNAPGARPATEADCLTVRSSGLSIQPGDMIAPAGLYASDHDMFAFMVNEEQRIDDGSDGGLARGFFISNSEVGAASLKIKRFLYRFVCGNHIVWDAKDVQELRIVHTGNNDRRFGYRVTAELRRYANESDAKDRERVEACRRTIIGNTREEVIDQLFGKKILPRKTLEAAYDDCVASERGLSPRSVWGMVQGITSLSQKTDFADRRMEIDQAAGKLMSIAF